MMKTSLILTISLAFLLMLSLAHAEDGLPELNHDPDLARVVVDDLHRFWEAWDLAQDKPEQRREIFQRNYLEAGSPGLQSFLSLRLGDVDRLLSAIDAVPDYYISLRAQTAAAERLEVPLRVAYHRMRDLFPGAVFPDTYLVMGALTSGGTIDRTGILIGFEMNARTSESPIASLSQWHQRVIGTIEDLPTLIVHELVHIQQAVYGRLDFTDLLGQSIMEGAADFITELVMDTHPNIALHEWARAREEALWLEFQAVMSGTETGGWLYDGARATERPADLGYFIGYRIVEAYYRQAQDPQQALREIIGMTDPKAFLEQSGYAGRPPGNSGTPDAPSMPVKRYRAADTPPSDTP